MGLRAYGACVLVLAMSGAEGCARVRNETDVEQERSPGTGVELDAGEDASGPMFPSRDGDGSDGAEGVDDGSDAADGSDPTVDAGPSGPDAGSDGSDGADGSDGTTPPVPADGSCNAPYEISIGSNGGVKTAMGDTTGGKDSQAANCAPAFLALPGPDHVYHLKMPFAGEVEATGSPTALLGGFQPSVYLATACDDGGAVKACDYGGAVAFGAAGKLAAGSDVFIYVDSGGQDLGVASTPAEGAYTLEVAVRKLVGAGEPCGTGRTDPRCEGASLACRPEAGGSVCRPIECGDGHVEGSEQCDDGGKVAGDGCDAQCQREGNTCAAPLPLTFVQSGGSRVATVMGNTQGTGDDVDLSCVSSSGPEQFYSFTLTASTQISVQMKPTGFDAALALFEGTCSSADELDCRDSGNSGGTETISGTAQPGTFIIAADGYNGGSGAYELTVTLTP